MVSIARNPADPTEATHIGRFAAGHLILVCYNRLKEDSLAAPDSLSHNEQKSINQAPPGKPS